MISDVRPDFFASSHKPNLQDELGKGHVSAVAPASKELSIGGTAVQRDGTPASGASDVSDALAWAERSIPESPIISRT